VQRTVHYCEKTGVHSEMSYHDATSLTGFPTSSLYPTKDLEGNPLTTEFGLSTYEDHQVRIQNRNIHDDAAAESPLRMCRCCY
jgi:hypothetical protein